MRKSLLAAALLAAGLLPGQSVDPWRPFQFLIGKWKADNGAFTFLPDVKGKTVVRRNVNHTPGQEHEDLMVVYQEGGTKAIYFDSEGHVIRYIVTFPEPTKVVFESEGAGPKYRLAYAAKGDKLDGTFEVNGKMYLQWTAVKE
jgi:hypothetical protein